MRSRTKTQSSLPTEDAVFLLFGLMRSGQVTVRRLVAWQDLKSLPEAVMWQLDTRLLNSPHSDAKPLFHPLTDTTLSTLIGTHFTPFLAFRQERYNFGR